MCVFLFVCVCFCLFVCFFVCLFVCLFSSLWRSAFLCFCFLFLCSVCGARHSSRLSGDCSKIPVKRVGKVVRVIAKNATWGSVIQCVLQGTPHPHGIIQPFDFPHQDDAWSEYFVIDGHPTLQLLSKSLFNVRLRLFLVFCVLHCALSLDNILLLLILFVSNYFSSMLCFDPFRILWRRYLLKHSVN